MVYDQQLVSRIRAMLAGRHGFAEKKMFGEVSFLLNGKMCFGVIQDDLVVRVGPKIYEKALAMPHARPMDFMGKPMKGFVYVGSKWLSRNAALEKWLDLGMDYASSLLKKQTPLARIITAGVAAKCMSESVDKVAQAVRAALDLLQEQENIVAKIGVDREAGIVKIYGEKSDALKKASSGLSDVLELSYTTAEHHPYWGMLYHATEISKMLLEKWDSELSQDNLSEILWRCDEIRMAQERAGDAHYHRHEG